MISASLTSGAIAMARNVSTALVNASPPNGTHAVAMNVSSNVLSTVNGTLALAATASNNVSSIANASGPLVEDVVVPTFMLHSVVALAVVANSILYISPLNLVMRVTREQAQLKDLTNWLLPTYFMFAQSYFWACYGYCTGLSDLARFNCGGAVICTAYLIVISKFAQPRKTAQQMISASILVVLLFSCVVCLFSTSTTMRNRALGHAAATFNIGMVLAPLVAAIRAVETRLLDKLPLTIMGASFFSSVLWAQYALLVHDQALLIPNLVGAVVGSLELFGFYWLFSAGHGSGLAQSLLLDVENQPLMPRQRGKTASGTCSNFFSYLNIGQRLGASTLADVRLKEQVHANLRDHFHGPYSSFGEASPQMEEEPADKMVSTVKAIMKSPFGALDHSEDSDDLGTFSDYKSEPEFEPEVNARMNEFSRVIWAGNRAPTDCIL